MDFLNLTDPWSTLAPAPTSPFLSASTCTHPSPAPSPWLPSCALSQYPSFVPSAASAHYTPDPTAHLSRAGPAAYKQLSDVLHVTPRDTWASLTPP